MFKTFRRTLRSLRKLHETTSLVRDTLVPTIDKLNEELDALRSRLDVTDELLDRFQSEKKSEAYQSVYEKKSPLVSVCISTYNRGRLLVERSLKSVFEQDYKNLEIIVVGDRCTDNTPELIGRIKDERIRFVNLPVQGRYPEEPWRRWLVAGAAPRNHAMNLATGDFITHLDDDDEYTPDRINKLVKFIQTTRADIVWHPFWAQDMKRRWYLNKAEYFKKAQATTSSVFYHHWLKQIPWDINGYKYLEPTDWNRFRKMNYLGACAYRYDEPLLKHYIEQTIPSSTSKRNP